MVLQPPRGEPLREIWQKIPEGIDVLLTHGPPHGVLDLTSGHENAGCEDLRAALDRVRPRLHVFGHIHEGAGTQLVGRTLCVNAAICTQEYAPTTPIIVVDVPAGGGPCTVVSSPD
ncbi:MAG: hypothetical protein R3B70_27655 [Polyangiaceae bacterium]